MSFPTTMNTQNTSNKASNTTEYDVLRAAACVVIAKASGNAETLAEACADYRSAYNAFHRQQVKNAVDAATHTVRYHSGLVYPCSFDPATLEADTLAAARIFAPNMIG